jgi:sugar lactone lactonase YvrE
MSKTVGAVLLSTAFVFAPISVPASAFGFPLSASLNTVKTYGPGESPESIAIDRSGNAFVSVGNTIRKRTPAGVETTFFTLPIAAFVLGVKVGPDGCVYNTSTSLDPAVVGAFVWKTCTPGTSVRFATLDPSGGPNDLAFDDHRNLFVTDPFLGRVYKITPTGSVSTWLQHPLLDGNSATPYLKFHAVGVDGIAFDEDKENLYLGNLDYGRLIRVPVDCDGNAGTPIVVATDSRLTGIDGIALDEDGTIFAAINGQDHLVSVSRAGVVSDLFAGLPLDGPASVAFGTLAGTRKTLYIVSGAFMRTFGLLSGTPHPALLSTSTSEPGLPLP